MSGGVKMAEIQERERMQIRLSKTNMQRLQDMAGRYGMSANSLVSYIIGQWLDNNYDLKDKMREQMFSMFASEEKMEKVFASPIFVEMMGGLVKEMVRERQDSGEELARANP
jgi:hypothetical protein